MRYSLALVLAVVFSSAPTAMAQLPSGKIAFYREARSTDSIFIPAFFCDGIQLGRIPAGSYQEVSASTTMWWMPSRDRRFRSTCLPPARSMC